MRALLVFLILLASCAGVDDYFPPPDREGGWRGPANAAEALRVDGVDQAELDKAFEFIKATTKNGGLLVARRGRLVYERYFGRAHRDANPNHASVGKSYTSIAIGILMAERPELFPDGLDQKVFTRDYFPEKLFPLRDPRMKDIKLGQLLAMSAGVRGNNPGIVDGREVILHPAGPDGWQGMYDPIVIGAEDGENRGEAVTTKTLWVEPGGGYSYATASIHLASIDPYDHPRHPQRAHADPKICRHRRAIPDEHPDLADQPRAAERAWDRLGRSFHGARPAAAGREFR